MATTVFLSYNHAQIKLARQFARDLYDLGCDPWMDERKMVVSDHLVGAMKRGIQESDAFLLLWSREAEASRMVKKEVEDAAHERATRDAYPVMIIMLDPALAPPFHFDGLLYHSGKLTRDRATMPTQAYATALSSVTATLRQRELIQGLHFIEDVAAQSEIVRNAPDSWRTLINRAVSAAREYHFDGAGVLKEMDRDVEIDITEGAAGQIAVMDSREAALKCISDDRILGLLGEPGIGKTSALKRLACDLAGKPVGSTRKPIVPFYVSAIEFEKNSDLEGALSEKVGETRARFRSFLSTKAATVVLLLDDLQFISKSSQYSVHQQVLLFLRETEARLIVAFTDQSQTNLANIVFATLNNLSPTGILHALAPLTNNDRQIMSRLRRALWRPVIKDLLGNPRWLAKFAKVYISRTVPSWWELVNKTVDHELWGTLDVKGDLRQIIRHELERLAFHNTIEGARDEILVADLRQAAYNTVIAAKALWDEDNWNAALVSLNTGQVIRVSEESITFRVPAVSPALAAHFCIQNDQENIAHSDSEIIEDVILHVLANPEADAIRAEWYKSLDQLDVRFSDRLSLLGRGLSAGNLRVSSVFAETVDALERFLVCTGSFNALDLLVDFGSAVALKACDNLLAASDERIRGFATMLLERSVGLTALLRKPDYRAEGVKHKAGTMDISSVRRAWTPSLDNFPDSPVGQKAQELAAHLVQMRILSNGTRDRFINGEAELALFRHLIIRAVGDEDLGDLARPMLDEGIRRLGLDETFHNMHQIWFSQMLLALSRTKYQDWPDTIRLWETTQPQVSPSETSSPDRMLVPGVYEFVSSTDLFSNPVTEPEQWRFLMPFLPEYPVERVRVLVLSRDADSTLVRVLGRLGPCAFQTDFERFFLRGLEPRGLECPPFEVSYSVPVWFPLPLNSWLLYQAEQPSLSDSTTWLNDIDMHLQELSSMVTSHLQLCDFPMGCSSSALGRVIAIDPDMRRLHERYENWFEAAVRTSQRHGQHDRGEQELVGLIDEGLGDAVAAGRAIGDELISAVIRERWMRLAPRKYYSGLIDLYGMRVEAFPIDYAAAISLAALRCGDDSPAESIRLFRQGVNAMSEVFGAINLEIIIDVVADLVVPTWLIPPNVIKTVGFEADPEWAKRLLTKLGHVMAQGIFPNAGDTEILEAKDVNELLPMICECLVSRGLIPTVSSFAADLASTWPIVKRHADEAQKMMNSFIAVRGAQGTGSIQMVNGRPGSLAAAALSCSGEVFTFELSEMMRSAHSERRAQGRSQRARN